MSVVDPASIIFKSLVWDIAIKKYSAQLITSLAISPTGFIGIIITKAIMHFADKLYPMIVTMLKVTEIKLSNEVHQRAYEKAQIRLKLTLQTYGLDSKEFKDEREIEHDKLLRAIVFNI